MTKHLVFVVGPGAGHVNPTLPLVEELVARGHRVTYITGEPFRAAVADSGATTLDVSWEAPSPKAGKAMVEIIRTMMVGMHRHAQENFARVVAHFRNDPTDVVCYDSLAPLGTLLADTLAVPGVMLSSTMASNEHFKIGSLQNAVEDEILEQVLAETVESDTRDTFDASHLFLGPSMGTRGTNNRWTPPPGGSPVLFVSLGTGFNDRPGFFARCVEAFDGSNWHVVMAVGRQVKLEKVPENFEVAPYFPQLRVLQYATVFLSHTGMNSTMEFFRQETWYESDSLSLVS